MPKKNTLEIPAPQGFLFSAAKVGIKYPYRKPFRKDMALIYSEADAVVAGAFTTNKVKGSPVKLCKERIGSGRGRAIVVNSGNSNDATGRRGLADSCETASIAAKLLGVDERLVYVSSTGVIGVPLPMERIRPGVASLVRTLGSSGPLDVSEAIMTTDTFPKFLWKKLKIGGKTGTVLGIAKGAGMIAPNMGTMLCFIMTDLAIKKDALRSALKDAVKRSFNRITIDGDMSPSDTAIVMANGMAGNPPITLDSKDYEAFGKALGEITYGLSKLIVMDGEGATKVIEVGIRGGRTEAQALKAAFSVANSSLVKTAVYGCDPNWGRVITALGYSGVDMLEEKTDIYFGRVKLVSRGVSTGREKEGKAELGKKEVLIAADLRMGRAKASVLTCDLTEDYVRVNAEYTT